MHILDFPWAVLRLKEVEPGKGWAGMGRWSWIGQGLDSHTKEFGVWAASYRLWGSHGCSGKGVIRSDESLRKGLETGCFEEMWVLDRQ